MLCLVDERSFLWMDDAADERLSVGQACYAGGLMGRYPTGEVRVHWVGFRAGFREGHEPAIGQHVCRYRMPWELRAVSLRFVKCPSGRTSQILDRFRWPVRASCQQSGGHEMGPTQSSRPRGTVLTLSERPVWRLLFAWLRSSGALDAWLHKQGIVFDYLSLVCRMVRKDRVPTVGCVSRAHDAGRILCGLVTGSSIVRILGGFALGL